MLSIMSLVSTSRLFAKWIPKLNSRSCRTFYTTYEQVDNPGHLDLVISPTLVPNDISTGKLNLYFPERFYKQTDHLGSLTNRLSIAEQFYSKHNLRNDYPEAVALADVSIHNGHYMDVPDDELDLVLMLVYVQLFVVDDVFEQMISHPDPEHARFGIALCQSMHDSFLMHHKSPQFPTHFKVSRDLIERAQLFREMMISCVDLAKKCMPPNHFRAWQRAHVYYSHYYVHYEAVARRLAYLEKRPTDTFEFLLLRTVAVGQPTISPYYLDPKWDLDREYYPDAYLYRMSAAQIVLAHDLISGPKERDTMNWAKLLEIAGYNQNTAALKTAERANELMVILERYYDQFPEKQKYIYAEMRTISQVTRYQLDLFRYGWRKKATSED